MQHSLTQAEFWITWIVTTVAMEFWARFLHGKIWHRSLWFAHKSHHTPSSSYFEFNDVLSLLHALAAIALIIISIEIFPLALKPFGLGLGIGMSTFGISYFLIHDGYIHGRLPLKFLDRFSIFQRIKKAHQLHHEKNQKGPYGLFLGAFEKDFIEYSKQSKK